MTDAELRDLIAENSRKAAENNAAILQLREDSERRWAAWEKRWAQEREDSERRWAAWEIQRKEDREYSARQWRESQEEIYASRRETDRLITSLERRLGEIGNALGLYTESMFVPSLKRILRARVSG